MSPDFFVGNLILNNFYLNHFLEQSGFFAVVRPRLQRVRLAHFGRRNYYHLLSYITGMPDISLPFILLSESSKSLP